MAIFLGERVYEDVQRLNKELLLKETAAPSATDGYGSLYVQSDGYLYYKDFNGTQTDLVNVAPAGSDREIQFNNAGILGASSGLILSASNELEVDGYTYLNSGLAVSGDEGVSGDLTVSGNTDVNGNLTVSGEIHNTQLQNTLDGYSTAGINYDDRIEALETSRVDILEELDGYALASTENQHWIESVSQRQNIRDALDGYITVNQDDRVSALEDANDDILESLDGYSTLTTSEGADGYIAFFTGSNSMAGDNDLFYNRATGDVTIGSGGNLSVSGGVTVGADGYSNLEVTGQVWSNMPGNLAPSGSNTNIDFNEGNARTLNLANADGPFTVTLSNMQAGATYVIKIIQHASSPVTVAFTNSILWEGSSAYSATQSNSAIDFITLFYDGTDFIGSYLLNLG